MGANDNESCRVYRKVTEKLRPLSTQYPLKSCIENISWIKSFVLAESVCFSVNKPYTGNIPRVSFQLSVVFLIIHSLYSGGNNRVFTIRPR